MYAECPMCRAPFVDHGNLSERIAKIKALLERLPGRYTPVAQDMLGELYFEVCLLEWIVHVYFHACRCAHICMYGSIHVCNHACFHAHACVQGKGVPKNVAEACRLWEAAAESGYLMSAFNVSVVHFGTDAKGAATGMPRDAKKACFVD